ncbi:MAG: HU family DNA-binding protein [Tannerella sp.]|jgi:DNA-binding protein HU-beta|nr:HU family DNA-binding protein [Tannerella sp.]
MKDAEVVTELSIRLNWEKKEVESMLTAFSNIIGNKLANNDMISLHGLGQFEPKKKAERVSANPTNGKRYIVPPKLVPIFKPVPTIKSYLKTLDNNE